MDQNIIVNDCPADVDLSGVVDSIDLLLLLGDWGPGGGWTDLDRDGTVTLLDMLELLGSWGPCP